MATIMATISLLPSLIFIFWGIDGIDFKAFSKLELSAPEGSDGPNPAT